MWMSLVRSPLVGLELCVTASVDRLVDLLSVGNAFGPPVQGRLLLRRGTTCMEFAVEVES